ncbi:MAG: ATP-binding protein, partial [Thermomicrobiales bacterium]
MTQILGRENEIDRIVRLLDRDDLRLLTLLGPGGVGKTRLAQEVTRLVAPDFAHGVCFVSLASIRDPGLVPKAVAQAVGIQESSDRDAVELLAGLLAGRHLLLVLDNLEQVIAASGWLADLLARCSRLKVLVTSRIALDIAGEQRMVVPPLPVPSSAEEVQDENAAVELFCQRARAVDLTFHLNNEHAGVVAEICRRLDGLPLAIELAAARVKVLSPEAILARLTNRLTLLTGGRRDVPDRLRSMRDAIGWSYDLLPVPDQRVFCRLSTFAGGFTLEAAAFVAAWPESRIADDAVMDGIGRLIDHSLIQPTTGGLDSRFQMLETIREYGLQEIATSGQDDLSHLAHAEYYRQLADQAQTALIGPDQATWLNRLDAELPNIRGAMTWLEAQDRLDDAILLNARIQWFLNIRGHSVET